MPPSGSERSCPSPAKGGCVRPARPGSIEGEVRMEKNWALVDYELAQGFVLTCQSHPTSDRLVVDYDV